MKITKKEISVTDRTKDIRNILRDKKKVSFFDLFEVKPLFCKFLKLQCRRLW